MTKKNQTAQAEAVKPKRTRKSGAGVKADDGAAPLERVQVRLDPVSESIFLAIGTVDGKENLSLGIREAARRLEEAGDIKPFSLSRHMKRYEKSK